MKVVLDTNILVSVLSKRSKSHWVIDALEDERFLLVVSQEILLEYEEILLRKYNAATVSAFFSFLRDAENVKLIAPNFHWNFLNDPDDNKFVDAAIASGADFLVTEDRDYRGLKDVEFPEVKVLRLHEFEQLLKHT